MDSWRLWIGKNDTTFSWSGLTCNMLIRKAISLGASDARMIPIDQVHVDPSIVDLCMSPRCSGYAQCANCPPFVMDPQTAKRWITNYNEALLLKKDFDPFDLLAHDHMEHFREMFLMVTAMERLAMKRGFKDAAALGAGSCKPVFCPERDCAVLEGKPCPYPHLARPSLEALGINVFDLAKKVGWQMYKILRETDPNTVPSASLVGMVLLAKQPNTGGTSR